jgi:hypothetical protein
MSMIVDRASGAISRKALSPKGTCFVHAYTDYEFSNAKKLSA